MAEEHNALKYGPQISQAGSVAAGGGYGDVGISRISETLTPTMDLWSLPEWYLLRGERLYARRADAPAVAGRFSSLELVNPAGSSTLCVVELIGNEGSDCFLNLDTGTAIAANPVLVRGRSRDSRNRQLGDVSICTITTGDLAAGIVGPMWRLDAGTPPLQLDLVIAPAAKLFIVTGGAAAALDISLSFRERTPFPGELQARG